MPQHNPVNLMGRTRYDKLVNHDSLFAATTVPRKLITIKKVDADSVPAAYIKSVKVSIMDNTSSDQNVNYSLYAALDSGVSMNTARVIDHGVVGPGGGTLWLNIGRKIWRTVVEDGEVGDPITIWLECSENIETLTWYTTTFSLRALTENV